MLTTLSELHGHRDLLRNFLARDLRVRYKASALGVVWSLLNPLLMMAVYTVVFDVIMHAGGSGRGAIRNYPVFFMAGFLPWTFFATALQMGSFSLVAHGNLLQKVYFPREVLPLSMTLANLVNLGIALAVFVPFAFWISGIPSVLALLALIPVTAALFLLAAGLAMVLSAVMVYFRDVEFLLGIGLTAWFFMTPVVYQFGAVPAHLQRWFRLNPMLPFIQAYRDAFYDLNAPALWTVGKCLIIGVVVFVACYAAFNRLKGRVAEEL